MLETKQGSLHCNPSKAFVGVQFFLFGFDFDAEQKLRSKIVTGGGVESDLTREGCTHVIVDKVVFEDPVCVRARKNGKAIVTSLWVHHSYDTGMPADTSLVIYTPVKDFNGIPAAKSLVVCLTGYQRQDRDDIMTMVGLMGAQFSKPLVANKVTHLICYKFEGEKYELAKKIKRIKLVNHQWLEDCLRYWDIVPENKYTKSGYELELVEEAKDSDDEAEVPTRVKPTSVRSSNLSNLKSLPNPIILPTDIPMEKSFTSVRTPPQNKPLSDLDFSHPSSKNELSGRIKTNEIASTTGNSPRFPVSSASKTIPAGFSKMTSTSTAPGSVEATPDRVACPPDMWDLFDDGEDDPGLGFVTTLSKKAEVTIAETSEHANSPISKLVMKASNLGKNLASHTDFLKVNDAPEGYGSASGPEELPNTATETGNLCKEQREIGTSVLPIVQEIEQSTANVAKNDPDNTKNGNHMAVFSRKTGHKSLGSKRKLGMTKTTGKKGSIFQNGRSPQRKDNSGCPAMEKQVVERIAEANDEKATSMVKNHTPVEQEYVEKNTAFESNGSTEAVEVEKQPKSETMTKKSVVGEEKGKNEKSRGQGSMKRNNFSDKTGAGAVIKNINKSVSNKKDVDSEKKETESVMISEKENMPTEMEVISSRKELGWFILSGHRLQRREFQKIIKCLKGRICRDSHHWSYQASHFIVPNPVRRTEKLFAAMASGKWVLKTDYLTASIQEGKFLAEEAYEWHRNGLSEDGTINLEAPRKWRLLRERTGHGAFYSMRILIYGECIAPPLDTLKRVVKAGDGVILATCPPYTRFLTPGNVDYVVVSPGMPCVDVWVAEFLRNDIPCVLADYLVEYVCKPGYPLDRHVLYKTQAWAERSFDRLQRRSEEAAMAAAEDDLWCGVCGRRDREEVMLICGDERGRSGCGVGTHIDCCDPPLPAVPAGDWFCRDCTGKREDAVGRKKRRD